MNTYAIYSTETGLFTSYHITCSSDYIEPNVQEGFSCMVGEYDHTRQKVNLETGEVEAYQPPSPGPNYVWDTDALFWRYVKTNEDLAREARQRRDELLAACDWVTLRAFRTGTAIPSLWAAYQTALADLPAQEGFPRDIIWPTPPTE